MSKEALERLQKKFPNDVLGTHSVRGDETALIRREALTAICTWLKESPEMDFNMLTDLTVVDYLGMPAQVRVCSPGTGARFEVVYHLNSLGRGMRLRLKVPLEADEPVLATVTKLWRSATWMEREAWDLYGIRFEGGDQRRILLYEEFVGHPLRKDYPMKKRQPLIPMKNPNA